MSKDALRALHAMTRFEMAEIAATVARSVKVRDEAQQMVGALTERCGTFERELRDAMSRAALNPDLLSAMRRLYRSEHQALGQWQAKLAAARLREEEASLDLARVRNRERSLERAIQAQRRVEERRQASREMAEADDRWLQQRRAQ